MQEGYSTSYPISLQILTLEVCCAVRDPRIRISSKLRLMTVVKTLLENVRQILRYQPERLFVRKGDLQVPLENDQDVQQLRDADVIVARVPQAMANLRALLQQERVQGTSSPCLSFNNRSNSSWINSASRAPASPRSTGAIIDPSKRRDVRATIHVCCLPTIRRVPSVSSARPRRLWHGRSRDLHDTWLHVAHQAVRSQSVLQL